jgi:predicted glycosyltransferase
VGGAGASLSPALPPTAANTLATESALLGLIAVSGAIGNTTTAAIDSGAVTTPR